MQQASLFLLVLTELADYPPNRGHRSHWLQRGPSIALQHCYPVRQNNTARSTQWCQSGAAGHGSAQWHRSAPCLLDRPEWQLAVTFRPSKVLPFCTYVVHMDPVCPKCMPTKAANRPVKRTCPVHRSGSTRNTLSFADAYSMKMGTGAGVKCLFDVSNSDAWYALRQSMLCHYYLHI